MGRRDCAGREIVRIRLFTLCDPKVYTYVTTSLQRINLIRPDAERSVISKRLSVRREVSKINEDFPATCLVKELHIG